MQKRTKIIATLSHTVSQEEIERYRQNGMDAVRINTAHESIKGARELIKKVRSCSREIALILDTKGPDIRVLGPETKVVLSSGDQIQVSFNPRVEYSTKSHLFVNYSRFVEEIPLRSRIVIDDQQIELSVIKKKNGALICRVTEGGTLHGNKGINVPGIRFSSPSLTKQDKTFLKLAVEEDIDYIAHSFVRTKDDINSVRRSLQRFGKQIPIIAKIENQQGVEQFNEIIDACEGIMVARGDLGIEIPLEDVPVIQKEMILRCTQAGKIGITATQMLYSMIHERHPTRAEVSDVANAVYDGSDALMLSGETAYGTYPTQAIMMMTKIIRNVELHKSYGLQYQKTSQADVSSFIAHIALLASHDLLLNAIIVDDDSHDIARLISSQRIKTPLIAVVSDDSKARALSLRYGITGVVGSRGKHRLRSSRVRLLLESLAGDETDLLLLIKRESDGHRLKTEICTRNEFLNT